MPTISTKPFYWNLWFDLIPYQNNRKKIKKKTTEKKRGRITFMMRRKKGGARGGEDYNYNLRSREERKE